MKKNLTYQIILPALLFCSFSAVSSIPVEKLVEEELDIIYQHIESISYDNTIYTERDGIYSDLRDTLLDNAENQNQESILFAIPHLDIETFNHSIGVLNRWFSRKGNDDEKKYNKATILHTWSFISGIKVFGLKHDSVYYYRNEHIIPNNDNQLRYTKDYIMRGKKKKKVPTLLKLTSVFYRTDFGKFKFTKAEESQELLLDFFIHELEEIRLQKPMKVFLESVLALKNNKPVYSLGIMNLLQNTAVYFSHDTNSADNSRVIIGPCSLQSTSYLGLQDGIFFVPETINMARDRINRLMGIQIFYRLFHKAYPDEKLCPVNYYPHYGMLEKNSDWQSLKDLGEQRFCMRFDEFIRDVSNDESKKYSPIIAKVCVALDNLQLKTPLKIKKNRWFDSEEILDLDLQNKSFYLNDAYQYFEGGTPHCRHSNVTYGDIVEHLYDPDYQNITILKIHGFTGEILDLFKALQNNILPNLHTLDVSGNLVNADDVSHFLKDLLNRDTFHLLIAIHSFLDQELLTIQGIPLQKIIWLPEDWINTLQDTKKISKDVYEAHKNYYEQLAEENEDD